MGWTTEESHFDSWQRQLLSLDRSVQTGTALLFSGNQGLFLKEVKAGGA
jgi:hypothetical protein